MVEVRHCDGCGNRLPIDLLGVAGAVCPICNHSVEDDAPAEGRPAARTSPVPRTVSRRATGGGTPRAPSRRARESGAHGPAPDSREAAGRGAGSSNALVFGVALGVGLAAALVAGLLLTGGEARDVPRPKPVADAAPNANAAPPAAVPADAQPQPVPSAPAPDAATAVAPPPAPPTDSSPAPAPPPPPADGDDDDDDDYFARLRVQMADRKRKLEKLTIPADKPPLPDVYVTDLKPEYLVLGWGGTPKVNMTICSNPLRVDGTEYANGLGAHSPSDLAYAIEPNYRRFVATAAQDDEADDDGAAMFMVYIDDEPVVASALMYARKLWHFNVEIPRGSKKIRLVITDGEDGDGYDHVNWLNAGFVTE